jgi:hypothetical protein
MAKRRLHLGKRGAPVEGVKASAAYMGLRGANEA